MEIKEMQMSDIEQRSLEIEEEMKNEGADIDALTAEVNDLEARKVQIEEEVEQRKKEAEEALKTAVEVEKVEEVRRMSDMEIRNTKEYIDAYADYIKTGKDVECRTLLSENNSGTVAVPEFVYDIVKTAWQKEGIMSLVRKAYVKGNLKVGFEISGTDAVVHTEGGDAVSEETLTLGTVNMVPASIKKWIDRLAIA